MGGGKGGGVVEVERKGVAKGLGTTTTTSSRTTTRRRRTTTHEGLAKYRGCAYAIILCVQGKRESSTRVGWGEGQMQSFASLP